MGAQHWADQLAEQIVQRAERERLATGDARSRATSPNVKCQQTPSGGKHIGNLNDVVRAWFPCEAVREGSWGRGAEPMECTFVHTTDDRDPLKDVPKKLPDLDGGWHESAGMGLGSWLGHPLVHVPDPFGCCKSWAAHFTDVWMRGVRALGMEPELHSVDQLYREGKFEPYLRKVFEQRELVGQLVAKFQKTKGVGYIPFDAICAKCGVLTNVDDVDVEGKRVHYVCGGKAIKKKRAEGCGHEAWQGWGEGKLQWRFEWPALWGIFHTTYEPFGKDHAEGSWPSGQEIARSVFGIEPPIPFVYEFFLVNGQKMSASVGNVYIVQDLLKLVEPEVFLYFYTKRPGKQRDLDLTNIQLLVEDFEHAERVFFGAERERLAAGAARGSAAVNEKEMEQLKRSYALCFAEPPERQPYRLPYLFASMLAQLKLPERALFELLERTGHLKEAGAEARTAVLRRVALAGNWIERFAPEQHRFRLQDTVLEVVRAKLLPEQRKAVREFAQQLKPGMGEEELTQLAFTVAKRHAMPAAAFFQACYWLLLAKASGPRLSHVILAAGEERARRLLEHA